LQASADDLKPPAAYLMTDLVFDLLNDARELDPIGGLELGASSEYRRLRPPLAWLLKRLRTNLRTGIRSPRTAIHMLQYWTLRNKRIGAYLKRTRGIRHGD
jgi:hypothetical protein